MLENIRKACEARFKDEWANTSPVRWPGVPFKQPATTFVVFGIRWSGANVTSLGTTKRHEQNGFVILTIHTPKDEGSSAAYALADTAQAVFRDAQLTEATTTVNFYECAVGQAGEGATGFSLNVTCRFKADDVF